MIDLLFPPFCPVCEKSLAPPNRFCLDCTAHLIPPSPLGRCLHCFVEIDRKRGLCPSCYHKPLLSAGRAWVFETSPATHFLRGQRRFDWIGPYLVWQIGQLGWDLPDRVIPLPDPAERTIWPLIDWVAKKWKVKAEKGFAIERKGIYNWRLNKKKDLSFEEETLLVVDWGSSLAWIESGLAALAEGDPAMIRVISLWRPQ